MNGQEKTSARKIILYDGVCGLCNHFVKFIIRNDKQSRFYFLSQQSSLAHELVEQYGYQLPSLETIAFVDEANEIVLFQSKAVIAILAELNSVWKIFSILPENFANCLYNVVAKNRYSVFGRHDSCLIPPREHSSRFLG